MNFSSSPPLTARAANNLRKRLGMMAARAGYGRLGSIPPEMTFREWCEDLARQGMKIDRKPFSLSDRPALIPLYDAIPTTIEEAFQRMLIVMKATQLGLTVWEMLADLYMAKKFSPVNIGMFLPDVPLADFKSQHRFLPIVESAPSLLRELTTKVDEQGNETKIGAGNIRTRVFGQSLLMFLWSSGGVTTESRPMDIVSMDEVQGMTLEQIDKIRARVGDSRVQYVLMLSTANIPDADIDHWYKTGTMEVWHSRCRACGKLSDLSDPVGIFPDRSITFNSGQVPYIGAIAPPRAEYVYTCPHCAHWIPDAQDGEYVATNPAADPHRRSFLLPRTISPRETPRSMLANWRGAKTGDQKKSFYNRTLARPYIDANQLPVTMAMCEAAAEEGMRRGLKWLSKAKGTFMGIDQMGGFNAVIIKAALPDGRQAVVHAEAIFDDDPFKRSSELMDAYGVSVCVCDLNPNSNDAIRFMNKHPGKVFLATYSDMADNLMRWSDQLDDSDRRTEEEARIRYSVTIDRYKLMQAALHRIKNSECLFPDPAGLEQEVMDGKERKRIHLLRDWIFLHFTKTALIWEINKKTGKGRPTVMKVGIDPHFAFANMFCEAAWARKNGLSTILMPEDPAPEETAALAEIESALPGLPAQVAEAMRAADAASNKSGKKTCGGCAHFEDGRCGLRHFSVRENEDACFTFEAA